MSADHLDPVRCRQVRRQEREYHGHLGRRRDALAGQLLDVGADRRLVSADVAGVDHAADREPQRPRGREQEALAEIGNVILNGCMATIANLLERSLTMSLPEIIRGSGLNFFDLSPSGVDDGILFVRINFTLKGREISGYVAIVMDFLSLEALRALVADFIRRATG